MARDDEDRLSRTEWRILSPLATRVRSKQLGQWFSLTYQTQYGPEFDSFPYYPAAMEMEGSAREEVHSLSRTDKALLVEAWRAARRVISITPEEAILDRYGLVVLDIVIRRAKKAGSRTSF